MQGGARAVSTACLLSPSWPLCAHLLPHQSELAFRAKITRSWDRGVQPLTFPGHNADFFFFYLAKAKLQGKYF